MVYEVRRLIARDVRLGDPQLDAVQHAAVARRRLLRMGHTAPGGHQVELPGADRLLAAEAVGVHDLALDQPRHRLKAGVGVRTDLHASARPVRRHRPEVVGEAPRPDRPPLPPRQRSAHVHATDAGGPARHELDGRALWVARLGGVRRGVRGGDRSAHRFSFAGPAGPAPRRPTFAWGNPPTGVFASATVPP
jgi:hypothetical protein